MSNARLVTFSQLVDNFYAAISEYMRPRQNANHVVLDPRKVAIDELIASVRAIKNNHCMITLKNTSLLEMGDTLFSLKYIEEIIALFAVDPEAPAWKLKITEFLKLRSERVLNGPLCYTLNANYNINTMCVSLARLCDPERVCSLLMPLVRAEDIYGNELDKLTLGQFILSDDKKGFISLPDIVGTVFSRSVESEADIYLTTTEEGQQRSLTPTEMKRLGSVHARLEEIRHQITDQGFLERLMRRNENRVREELINLRNGLRDGDARHGGEEMNAGADANLAIVRFREFYATLGTAKQNQISAITDGHRTLGQLFDIIFRDPAEASRNAGTSVIYCMAIVGGQLENIINSNRAALQGINNTLQECIDRLKEQLLSDIESRQTIQLGGDFAVPVEAQLTSFMDDLTMCIASLNISVVHSDLMLNMASFIFSECQRLIKAGTYNTKLNCYADLLLALGLEANRFDQHSHEDNVYILNEIFKRITLLSSCSSAAVIAIYTPDSKIRWAQWMNDNSIIQDFPFIIEGVRELKYIQAFLELFPLNGQRNLATTDMVQIREREAAERAVALREAARMEAERIAAEQAALQAARPAASPQQNPAQFFSRWPLGARETAVVAAGAAFVAYKILM